MSNKMSYAEYGQYEVFEDDDRLDNNTSLVLNPQCYPVGTRIVIYVPIDEDAQADWPGMSEGWGH
jgi:hypothetical protein